MQISACIICKNEEQYIGKCIQALRALPVHIVVADTGSTDNTLSILEKLLTSNDTLCHFEWCNDFSMARNFVLYRHRLIGSGWWTLMRS